MATKKYLTKYARGRKQIPKLEDGLRAMQIQSQTQTQALEQQKNQQKLFDAAYSTGLDRAAKVAEANRKLKRQVEVETPEKLREAALKRNNQTQQNNFKVKIKEQQEIAKTWGKLSPTLAANAEKAIGQVIDYFQTEAGIDEYERELADGTVGSISKVYQKAKGKVDFLDFSQKRFNSVQKFLKTGSIDAKQDFDYLTHVNKSNNPVNKDIVLMQHKKMFDGYERDFRKFLEQSGIVVDKKNVVGLYQFRAQEFMKQNGINPKSELGLQLQNLYRQKGFAAQHQLSLADDYESNTQVINSFSERIKALSMNSEAQFTRADFDSDAEFESVKKAFYNRKNALFVDAIASVNARPVQNRDGTYSNPTVPNTRANIVGWAKSEMDNYNDFQTFLEHVMGVTPDNQDGYLIPGAEKDTPKNHILAKFPYLKQELADDFAERFREKEKNQDTLNKARQQTDALKYQQRMNDGYYKDNPDAFFSDWEASNGNPYARELFAGSLGFKSKYINAETLNSTLVRAYKSGDTRLIYHAWAALPNEQQAISAGNPQALGSIYKDLNDLSAHLGVPMIELDKYLLELSDKIVTEVERDGALDKSSGPSAANLAEYIRSDILARYSNDRNGTAEERYNRAKSAVDKELGYSNGVLTNFVNDYRGTGKYKQKRGKSGATNKVIFMAFAGEDFGNITSFEIDATLGNTKRTQRLEGLVDLVREDLISDKPTISDAQIYSLLKTGNTNNRLLNHLLQESTLSGVPKEDFVNGIKNIAETSAKTKKSVMQWGGDRWCLENISELSAPAIGTLTNNQKALQVCVESIENNFDMPAWEFLLNAKNRELLQN